MLYFQPNEPKHPLVNHSPNLIIFIMIFSVNFILKLINTSLYLSLIAMMKTNRKKQTSFIPPYSESAFIYLSKHPETHSIKEVGTHYLWVQMHWQKLHLCPREWAIIFENSRSIYQHHEVSLEVALNWTSMSHSQSSPPTINLIELQRLIDGFLINCPSFSYILY